MERTVLLKKLALLQGDIATLIKELSTFGWDSEAHLYTMSKEDFISILQKHLNKEITLETLINWANSIECRDDLGFENDVMQEVVFELANPEVYGEITEKRVREIVEALLVS